jgi:hypothetical protein
MSTSTPTTGGRPRPVVWYGVFTAAVGAFLGFAGLTDLMPKTVIAWVALVAAVATAGGAVLVQSTTTPLSSPQDARGVPMVPVDTIPASTTVTDPGGQGLKWTDPGPRTGL